MRARRVRAGLRLLARAAKKSDPHLGLGDNTYAEALSVLVIYFVPCLLRALEAQSGNMALDVDPVTPPRGAGRAARVNDMFERFFSRQVAIEEELMRVTKDTALLALTHTLRTFFVGTETAAPGVDGFPQYRFKRCRRRTRCTGWWVYSSDSICCQLCRVATDNGRWPCIRGPEQGAVEQQILYEMVVQEDLAQMKREPDNEGVDEEGEEAMLEMDLEEILDASDDMDGTLSEARALQECRAEDSELQMRPPSPGETGQEDSAGDKEGMEVLMEWEDDAREDRSLADPELNESESERSA